MLKTNFTEYISDFQFNHEIPQISMVQDALQNPSFLLNSNDFFYVHEIQSSLTIFCKEEQKKSGVTLKYFEKAHPPQKESSYRIVYNIQFLKLSTLRKYRVFIKYCVFSIKCCDFSELCQFCCSAGILTAI